MGLYFSLTAMREVEVCDKNITHNLAKMASEAGLYEVLWRPAENGYRFAAEIIKPLEEGLKKLQENEAHMRQFEPENGWGTYRGLVEFVKGVLEDCKNNPDAKIEADV